MVFRHKSGAIVDIDVLRPSEWVERNQLGVGSEIAFGNSEIETTGGGRVTGIGPCPPIADGPGSVVTARYVTRQTADLVTATFADGTELTGTRQHPVWCVTRQAWVGLGELLPGEEVETRQGPLAVRSVEAVPGLQPVYNLEVHGEHVYEVTDVGVLVHNNTGADCLDLANLQNRIDIGDVLEADDLARYAKLIEKIKPKHAPDTAKWLSKNGKIRKNSDGSWTYSDWDGNSVNYRNGFPDFEEAGFVRQKVVIDMKGNYTTDPTNADLAAPLGPKLSSSVWHHNEDLRTMQEIDRLIHQRFTHRGAVSILGEK